MPILPQELFGFSLKKSKKREREEAKKQSFAPPSLDDGAIEIETATSGFYSYCVNVDGTFRNEKELIKKYREMSLHPEVQSAIEDIVNEAIITGDPEPSVTINLDRLEQPQNIKDKIAAEFEEILGILQFETRGYDMFRRWYIDSKMYFHVIVDKNNTKLGIIEARPVDALRITKVRENHTKKDPKTGADIIESVDEYYVYTPEIGSETVNGIRIHPDSIVYTSSGLFDSTNRWVIGYLHKAIKPLNQLRMMEDAVVIYRISRAPERRVFYIDVGNLQRNKAEQYVKSIMNQYRNKLVYDAATGEIKDDRNHMSMLEDFFMPRREGGRGTEVTTLPGGEGLGRIEDIEYFKQKLYKSLNVPVGRLDPEQQNFSLGRASEITRDELKFSRFVSRLRNKFSEIFYQLLKIQLILKGIIAEEDWNEIRGSIFFDFNRDSYFAELKEAEIMQERMNLLNNMRDVIGKYYSHEWVMKNILKMTDDEVAHEEKIIKKEKKDPRFANSDDEFGGGGYGGYEQTGGMTNGERTEPDEEDDSSDEEE